MAPSTNPLATASSTLRQLPRLLSGDGSGATSAFDAARNARLACGALTGAVTLIAMIRLVGGAFTGALSAFAWIFLLLAMVPWVAYVMWRARRSALAGRAALAVLSLGVVGLLAVWLSTSGAVFALCCSFAAFVVIWLHDMPAERLRGSDQFVRFEDLAGEQSEQQ